MTDEAGLIGVLTWSISGMNVGCARANRCKIGGESQDED